MLLPSVAFGHDTLIVGPKAVDIDTRGFPSTLKSSISDFTLQAGSNFQIVLRTNVANGDDDVIASPVYGDINPSIVLTGTSPTGCVLTTTDLDLATYDCTNVSSGLGAGDAIFTFNNVRGTPLTETVHWVIEAVDPVTPTAEVIPTGARNFFVASGTGGCCVGSDNNTGNDPAAPWASIAKVNSNPFQTGDNVYFRAGDTWTEQPLVIGWSGTSGDRVVVGSYYVVNGVAYANKPTNPTAWPTAYTYTAARAVIKGSCDYPSWSINGTQTPNTNCKHTDNLATHYPGNVTSGAIPNSYTKGLVSLNSNYVTFQDIQLRGSGGTALETIGSVLLESVVVQRVDVENVYTSGMTLTNTHNGVLRDSIVRGHGAVLNPYPSGFASQTNPICLLSAGAQPILAQYPRPRNDNLIEGNDCAQGSTGIGFYRGNYGLIIRGNRVFDLVTNHPPIYGDWGDDIVIEYNVIGNGDWGASPQVWRSRGIVLALENNNSGKNYGGATDVTIRGNMVVNSMDCVSVSMPSAMPTNSNFGGHTTMEQSGRIYGNSCLNSTGGMVNLSGARVTGGAGFVVKDNIFQSDLTQQGGTGAAPAPGPDICSPNTGAPLTTFDYNMWNTAPSKSACIGAHDVTGTAVVAGSNMSTKNSTTNLATPADFALQAGSPGLAAGTPLTSTIFVSGDFPQTLVVPCATFDLKGSAIDAICATRNATTPDLGAQERP